MDIYYHNEKQYVKLVKYKLVDVNEAGSESEWMIQIIRNKTLVLAHPSHTDQVKLRIPVFIQNLLIGLLRDSVTSESFKIRLYTDDAGIWCKFYMNIKYIADVCLRGGVAPDILSAVIRENGTLIASLTKPNYNDTEIPVFRNESQIWRLCYDPYLKISPYAYQHNNIHWLKNAEDAISRKERHLEYVETADLIHFKTKKFDFYLDPITSILYDHDSIWNCTFRCHKYLINGGVLCDEVGLGKTLSMTGLILSDKYQTTALKAPVTRVSARPRANPVHVSTIAPAPVKLRIKAKVKPKIKVATHVPDTDSELGTSTCTATKQMVSVIKRKGSFKELKLDPYAYLHKATGTTLVLCPRRLVNQWITEIQKYTDNLSVIEMSTLTHVKKYDHSDMDGVDVVVASFSLFDNKSYIAQDLFQLDQIHWRRVIVDEGHEVLLHIFKKRAADLRISTGIFSIKSDFRWICTGTPLPSTTDSLNAILSYVSNLGHNEASPLLNNIELDDYKRLMALMFHKNTRTSVKEQVTIPKHHESVEFLQFTKTERAIYDSIDPFDITRKLQVCTNLSVSDTDSEIIGGNILNLSQVTKAMGAYYMQNCERLVARIGSYKHKINTIEEDRDAQVHVLGDELEDAKLAKDKELISDIRNEMARIKTSARTRVRTLTEHIGKCQLDLVDYRKQLQTFRSLDIDHIGKSTCPIMGSKLTGKVAITPEGYYYSATGVELLFLGGRKVARCACTRKPVQLDSLTFVDTEAKSEQEEEVDVERSKWGTKMAHIVNKLRQLFTDDPDAKVIIFSQWRKMLLLMAKALKDCNINHVFCRGNVHMMSKSVRSFKTDPKTRVILLSSDSCNSGSNITEAQYVFLIDAVSGDIEHAKAAETQAIARTCRIGQTKEVQVYRFVVRDSVEEEYYKQMSK
jgi:SNF2 family DNA or RNA helicase